MVDHLDVSELHAIWRGRRKIGVSEVRGRGYGQRQLRYGGEASEYWFGGIIRDFPGRSRAGGNLFPGDREGCRGPARVSAVVCSSNFNAGRGHDVFKFR